MFHNTSYFTLNNSNKIKVVFNTSLFLGFFLTFHMNENDDEKKNSFNCDYLIFYI